MDEDNEDFADAFRVFGRVGRFRQGLFSCGVYQRPQCFSERAGSQVACLTLKLPLAPSKVSLLGYDLFASH